MRAVCAESCSAWRTKDSTRLDPLLVTICVGDGALIACKACKGHSARAGMFCTLTRWQIAGSSSSSNLCALETVHFSRGCAALTCVTEPHRYYPGSTSEGPLAKTPTSATLTIGPTPTSPSSTTAQNRPGTAAASPSRLRSLQPSQPGCSSASARPCSSLMRC